MPDTQAHDEVYCPDGGRQWVARQRVHSAGCQHLDLAKRPSHVDDDELLRLVLWLADGGVRRQAARDQFGGSRPKVPPGRPGPLSMGARVGPSSRPQPEPTKPEPEPPPQPTKPPEPEPPKPEAISAATLGKVERLATGWAAGSRSCCWWWSPCRSPGGSSPGPSKQVHLVGHAYLAVDRPFHTSQQRRVVRPLRRPAHH
jgi:hypothetical protein